MEDVGKTFSWSTFYSYGKKIRDIYPSVYKLKIKKKILDIIIGELQEGDTVLDVGASNRIIGEKINRVFPSVTYKTMDIDKAQSHDYNSLDDISETFDMIILSEVIEHLKFREGVSLLQKLWGLLNSDGKIIVSTPNLFHPHRYWGTDHKTPYRYDEISGALLSVGFRVDQIYRIYNDQFFKRFFRIYVAAILHRYLDIDFAKSIIVVASKK